MVLYQKTFGRALIAVLLFPEITLVKIKSAALIPPDKSYAQQMRRYEHQTTRAGLHKMHGLRHAYAQDRFLALAGFPCPAAGGPSREQLTPQQREADADARLLISAELGTVGRQLRPRIGDGERG